MDSIRALLAGVQVADPFERDSVFAQVTRGLFARETVPPRVGRYHLLERLGGGGQGIVHAAWDPDLGRRVAIKVLRVGSIDHTATERLRREAMALARLSDPHVVAVNDVGVCPAGVYVVMQLVPGCTLAEWLRVPRAWQEIVEALVQAGRGLVAAHAHAILHRDVKPSNIWIGEDGIVRILDFGLAQLVNSASEHVSISGDDTLETPLHLTQVGHVMGTPAYMAPEQHHDRPLGPATDQYAFCVTAFEALYGQRPWQGTTLEEMEAEKRRVVPIARPRDSKVPARLHRVVARGLHPDPDARWPSMARLVEALEGARASRATIGVSGVAVVLGVLGMAGTLALGGGAACTDAHTMTEVWSDARRSAISTSLERTSAALGRDAARDVGREIDAFSARWLAARDEACAASERSDAVASSRMRCLEGVRSQLDDALGILEHGGADVLEHTHEIVRGLPDPSACADPESHTEDPRLDEIRRELGRARSLGAAGATSVATDIARRSLERARPIRDEAVLAEAELAYGSLLLDAHDADAAAAELERAYLRASAGGHDALAFDSALALTSICASHRQDLDACALWIERASASLHRDVSAGDPSARGRLALGRAKQLFSAGRYAEALPHAREAAQQLEAAGDPRACRAIDITAKLLANVGEYEAARAEAERGIEVARRVRGDAHPATAAALTTYASMSAGPDQAQTALDSLHEALGIYLRLRGEDDLDVAEVRRRMANAQAQLGRKAEAARGYRQALEIQLRHLPSDDTKIAQTRYSLSGALRALGELEEAEALGREALRVAEATIGPDHLTTVIYMHGLGETMLFTDLEAARDLLERGAEIAERRLGPSHHLYAAYLTSLGKYARRRGDDALARQRLQQSLAIHDGPARGVDPEAREETAAELELVAHARGVAKEGRP